MVQDEKEKLVNAIVERIGKHGNAPWQIAEPVFGAIKQGLVEMCDDIMIEIKDGDAVITISFENNAIDKIVYFLNTRELKKILEGIENGFLGKSPRLKR